MSHLNGGREAENKAFLRLRPSRSQCIHLPPARSGRSQISHDQVDSPKNRR